MAVAFLNYRGLAARHTAVEQRAAENHGDDRRKGGTDQDKAAVGLHACGAHDGIFDPAQKAWGSDGIDGHIVTHELIKTCYNSSPMALPDGKAMTLKQTGKQGKKRIVIRGIEAVSAINFRVCDGVSWLTEWLFAGRRGDLC
jgi:hypothetical protein